MKGRPLRFGVLIIAILLLGGFLVWKIVLGSGFIGESSIRPGKRISKNQVTHPAVISQISAAIKPDGDRSMPTEREYPPRCTPKVISKGKLPEGSGLVMREGERSTGYSPLVSFEILESGDVSNVQLKRSSGFTNVDKYALDWIRSSRFNTRQGCGVIKTEADVTVDWR